MMCVSIRFRNQIGRKQTWDRDVYEITDFHCFKTNSAECSNALRLKDLSVPRRVWRG